MLTLLSLACTQICKKHVWVPIWEDTISLELSPLQFPSQMPFQLPFCSQFQYAVVSWKGKGPKDTFEQSTSYSKLWQCHSDTIDLNHPAGRLLLNRCQHQCPQPYTALFCCQFLRLSSVTLYWQTTICYECGAGLFAYSNKILLPCYVLDC